MISYVLNRFLNAHATHVILLALSQALLAGIPLTIINGTHGKFDSSVAFFMAGIGVLTAIIVMSETKTMSSYVWALLPGTLLHLVLLFANCMAWNYQPHKIFPAMSILTAFAAGMINVCAAVYITQQRRQQYA